MKLRETTPESVEVDYNSAVGAAAMGLKGAWGGVAVVLCVCVIVDGR